jgi:phage terminase large subunit
MGIHTLEVRCRGHQKPEQISKICHKCVVFWGTDKKNKLKTLLLVGGGVKPGAPEELGVVVV